MSTRNIADRVVSGFVYLVCSLTAAVAQPYNITLIPHPDPGEFNGAAVLGINDLGEAFGDYRVWDEQSNLLRAGLFIHSDAAGSRELPKPAGVFAPWAEGMNNSGQFTVYGTTGAGTVGAYRYTPGIGYQSLGTFGGETESRAINNLGQVTGVSTASDGGGRIFRYTDGVGLEELGPGIGRDINDRGWIAGSVGNTALLLREGNTINLGSGRAHGINNGGDVVGETYMVPGHPTAFVYVDGQMTILGDGDFSQPVLQDINGKREAVGYGFVGQDFRALYWSESTGGLVDLNTLIPENSGWGLAVATGINEHGQIIGWGGYNGEFAMFRLDPIPEPSTWALMVLGGAAFWVMRRRKR